MVTLYHFMRVWGIPDGSPFCVKLETYLRMAKIEYKPDNSFNIQKAPKGKFPLIEHKGQIIADSSLIIEYLKKEFGDSLDSHLTEEQKAQGLAVQRLVEEHLYWAGLYFRWVPDEAWAQLNPVFFGHMPMPFKLFLPGIIRKDMIKQTKGHGLGRHTPEEITKMAKDDLNALSTLLGSNKYFFNNQPSSIDACVFGLIANLYYCTIPSPVKDLLKSTPNLVEHSKSIREEYFPELVKEKESATV